MANTALAKLGEAPKDVEKALAAISEKCPKEIEIVQDYLAKIKAQDVTVLGQNEMLNLRDQGGEIRAFKRTVALSQKDGTLVQPVPGGPFVVSAQGYEKINQDTGTIVMNADYVLVDGKQQPNPYVMRDEKNGRILAIYARAIAFRYSPLGIPQVSDRTTVFDVPAYRLIDLLAKAKQKPQAFKLLPVGTHPEEEGTWAHYAFDENTMLWVNTSHEEALQFYAQIINREKKAIDFAQTFAQRNAAKHLHGIQKAPGPEWNLPVITWRPLNEGPLRWDVARYNSTQKALTDLAEGKTHGELPQIELTKGVDYVSDEPEAMDAEGEGEEEVEGNGNVAANNIGGNARQDPKNPTWKQLDAMKKAVPEIYEQALQELKIKEPVTIDDAEQMIERANTIADGGN